jgi:GntR family transcriptional regulator of arabinose operon
MIEKSYAQTAQAAVECLKSDDRPTAFVVFNDPMAILVIQAAQKLGMAVPDDLSVTGFDNSDSARKFAIPLTSIEPEKQEMGIWAVNILIDKLENPRPRPKVGVLIAPRLVMGQSTAKPHAI